MPRSDAPNESSYRSYNEVERELLRKVSFEELGLYFVLKEYANFYTGSFGTFNNQKMTYARLAREMQRKRQGSETREFDATAIKRQLEHLEKVGLVADRQCDGKRLTMLLPHSPIWKDNPARKDGNSGGEVAGKLPRSGTTKNAANPVAARDSSVSASPPSLVGSKEVNRPFFNTVTSATGHGETVAGDPERIGRPAPQAAGTGDVEDIDWSEMPGSRAALSCGTVTQTHALTEQQIGKILAAAGTVLYPNHPNSHAIYTSWVRKGLTRARLDEALSMAGDDAVTPKDLDALLYPKPAGRQFQAAVRRRGGVAL